MGDGIEEAASDVCLINLLTRIKQIQTVTKMTMTTKAATRIPTMAAALVPPGFLT